MRHRERYMFFLLLLLLLFSLCCQRWAHQGCMKSLLLIREHRVHRELLTAFSSYFAEAPRVFLVLALFVFGYIQRETRLGLGAQHDATLHNCVFLTVARATTMEKIVSLE